MTEYSEADPATTLPSIAAAPVLVILGSTRAARLCPIIAAWVTGIARASTTLD